MTDTASAQGFSARARQPGFQVTAWTGWVVFAGIRVSVLGLFKVVEGVVALFDRASSSWRRPGWLVQLALFCSSGPIADCPERSTSVASWPVVTA